MLTVKNLHIKFEGVHSFHALKGISFQIPKGKTLALVGASGSGKSLTSLAIMGLLPKNARTTGYIILEEKTPVLLNQLSEKEWTSYRGNKVGMVFQEPMSALNPIMSVGEQLKESIITHQKIKDEAAEKLAIEWFRKVHLPEVENLYKRYPHQLSGGQKQRVMIAMAMCNNPAVLIADEPTTALDVTVQRDVILLMKKLQEEFNTAMLFITHDMALAKLVADDFVRLEKGKVVDNITTLPLERNRVPALEEEVILKVKNISIAYPQKKNWLGKIQSYFTAVNNVSFEIKKGETLGLVGESGCGKSTLSKCILGLQPATSGNIFFKQEDITSFSTQQWYKLRKDIQIIFQDPYASLNPRIKIGAALSEPILIHNIASEKEVKNIVSALLEKVELPRDAVNKYPHEFSGGQRQRICIARALAVNPQLIICDECVSALDIKIQDQILTLLTNLQKAEQLTYLFITHDLKIVESVSDRIIVMQKGKIVESGDTHAVLSDPQHPYTQKLLKAVP